MDKTGNWKFFYWFLIVVLLFLPVTNSFFVNINKLIKSIVMQNEYKSILNSLTTQNTDLSKKVEYYKTSTGIKNLTKERLNKVDKGEIIIKFENSKMAN